jgi:hypothetical protein
MNESRVWNINSISYEKSYSGRKPIIRRRRMKKNKEVSFEILSTPRDSTIISLGTAKRKLSEDVSVLQNQWDDGNAEKTARRGNWLPSCESNRLKGASRPKK